MRSREWERIFDMTGFLWNPVISKTHCVRMMRSSRRLRQDAIFLEINSKRKRGSTNERVFVTS